MKLRQDGMIEMKNIYEGLELEIIRFESEDVITASGKNNTDLIVIEQ